MQQELINVAAHELRTPMQTIISLTELLRSQIKDVKQQEMLKVTIRNAKRYSGSQMIFWMPRRLRQITRTKQRRVQSKRRIDKCYE
jgi:signal transduction histidine kinase